MIRKSAVVAVLLAALAAVAVIPLQAQGPTAASAKIVLPYQVYWSGQIIPAGTYSVSYNALGPRSVIRVQSLDSKRSFNLLGQAGYESRGNQASAVTVVTAGDMHVIHELYFRSMNLVFTYRVPSAQQIELARNRAQSIPSGS